MRTRQDAAGVTAVASLTDFDFALQQRRVKHPLITLGGYDGAGPAANSDSRHRTRCDFERGEDLNRKAHQAIVGREVSCGDLGGVCHRLSMTELSVAGTDCEKKRLRD